tara:strand:- start:5795 stop:5989 length:195 start_codon:yes stop_codon:yes gene_type:complete
MKWALVVIALIDGHGPESFLEGIYDNIYQCFEAREETVYELLGSPNGNPPINHQAVCIRTDKYS